MRRGPRAQTLASGTGARLIFAGDSSILLNRLPPLPRVIRCEPRAFRVQSNVEEGDLQVNRVLRGLLWGLAVSCAGLVASPSRADVLFAVRVLREGGCGGVLPGAPPLHRNDVLDRGAAEWAAGRTLSEAVELSGYRAVSVAGLHVRGPDEAMLKLLKRSGCSTLASRGLHEMGLYRRGFDIWIVLATEHELAAGAREPVPAGQGLARRDVAAPKENSPSKDVTSQSALPEDAAVPTPAPDTVATAAPTEVSKSTPAAASAAISGPAPAVPAAAAKPASSAALTSVPKLDLSPILATRALQLVNRVRALGTRCGGEVFGPAPPVTLSGKLSGVAFGHANDMAEHNYFEHADLQGKTPSDRVRASGYQEKLVGENIAYGPKTVDEVVQGWLDSPGHCENIMDPRFAEMGVGYAMSHDSKHALYWVQVLAEPRSLAASR